MISRNAGYRISAKYRFTGKPLQLAIKYSSVLFKQCLGVSGIKVKNIAKKVILQLANDVASIWHIENVPVDKKRPLQWGVEAGVF